MVAVPASATVAYTSNVADASISRLDLRGGTAPVILPVGRQPEGIAVSPDGMQVWVGSNQDSTVTVLDPERRAVIATLRGFGFPYRMAISPDGLTAVISDPMRAEVRIYNAADQSLRFTVRIPSGDVVATTEVPGSPAPEGIALSRDSRWAFVTLQGRNRVVTIDLQSGELVGEAVTGTWSDGVAFSPITGP
jgi:YVTN family beta-propeller protein